MAVYSKELHRNEYSIGDQLWIYSFMLSACSHRSHHCSPNGKFESHKRITVWGNCCSRALCLLFWTDYWWVRPTNKQSSFQINFLTHIFFSFFVIFCLLLRLMAVYYWCCCCVDAAAAVVVALWSSALFGWIIFFVLFVYRRRCSTLPFLCHWNMNLLT